MTDGAALFDAQSINERWDERTNGKKVYFGVYVYYLRGTLYNGQTIQKKGDINLLR